MSIVWGFCSAARNPEAEALIPHFSSFAGMTYFSVLFFRDRRTKLPNAPKISVEVPTCSFECFGSVERLRAHMVLAAAGVGS